MMNEDIQEQYALLEEEKREDRKKIFSLDSRFH